MIDVPPAPLRLKLEGLALIDNWQALKLRSGPAECGAAVKANGYGLGAQEVVHRLSAAGCTQFFVAHWGEVAPLLGIIPSSQIAVLNGYNTADGKFARECGALPVLNSPDQITAWVSGGGGPCHVMLDSGINRLGIGPDQMGEAMFDRLDIDILMSHLASADEDSPQNDAQQKRFEDMSSGIACRRRSLANSAGIMLGDAFHHGLTRPGLSLYGGIPRADMAEFIKPVAAIEAQVIQIRDLAAGEPVGYNATFETSTEMRVATIAMGYADGYLRSFSGKGSAYFGGVHLPVIGRVSMDLITLDVSAAPDLRAGDWVAMDYDLRNASQLSGLSQYELLTGLGARFSRIWT